MDGHSWELQINQGLMYLVKAVIFICVCSVNIVWADTAKYINVKDAPYNAQGNGTTDDTVAIQTALNRRKPVHFPPGVYLVRGELTVDYPGQIVTGSGGSRTQIKVDETFNMTDRGVFVFTATPGPVLRDFRIEFFQPVSAPTRAHLIQYPPAVFIEDIQGAKLENIGIIWPWYGVYLKGDITGFTATDIEMLTFDNGFWFDGVEGQAIVSGLHFWGFGNISLGRGLSSDLNTHYRAFSVSDTNPSACIAVRVGSCTDFITLENLFGLNPYGLITESATAMVRVNNSWMERGNGILQNGGLILINNMKFSFASVDGYAVWKRSGDMIMSNTYSLSHSHNASHIKNEAGSLVWVGGEVYRTGDVHNPVMITGGHVQMQGCVFYGPNPDFTKHNIRVQGTGRLTSIGTRFDNVGATISYGNDNKHIVVGNRFAGKAPSGSCGSCQIGYNN